MSFRSTRRAALIAGICLTAAGAVFAQEWPTKTIVIVVPFAAGGTTDLVARALGEQLGRSLGQPVVVENRPGAGTTLGADYVAKSKPDGYTLLMGAVHHTIAPSVYKKLPYDFTKDLAPITTVAMVPNALVINPEFTSVKSVAELVALAKASPGKLSFGSNGNGTAQHLMGMLFQSSTGTTLLHVPYKGSAPLTVDLLGGQVNMSFDSITTLTPHIATGKLRALAVTTRARTPFLPDVPTMEEAGLKGFGIETWYGVLAPAATPKAIVNRLNAQMLAVIRSPEFVGRIALGGCEALGSSEEAFEARIASETARFAKIAKEGNIQVE